MGNKGCGGDKPGRTTRPWQRRSCCRYGNDSRQTMFDHDESRLEIVFLPFALALVVIFVLWLLIKSR
jgi:hypothetical protein